VRDASRLTLAVAALVVLLAGGCGRLAGLADTGASPGVITTGWPAASAGLVCGLIEYDVVAGELGVRFDTAGGAHVGDTYTCALTRTGQEFPDLTLALAATTADDLIFAVGVAPPGSTAVKGLGRAAYQLIVAAGGEHGPGIELGWLSAGQRLGVLRFTFATGADGDTVNAMVPKLLAMARRIDKA
jgi:hypothetical protein